MLTLVGEKFGLHTRNGLSGLDDPVEWVEDHNLEAGWVGLEFDTGAIQDHIQHKARENPFHNFALGICRTQTIIMKLLLET